ncbi:hypothetical protein MtrunA17_Chr5g0437341 [Medicago truncatula]|uniref:Transmembrane protein n=1 Tax=Medicago truncatula TaxID=3880 RepID=A0A396HUY3_MEDTR|nr:hypothetical protein MtrunA17_Chr5g0437341 [Medicago truncatula]
MHRLNLCQCRRQEIVYYIIYSLICNIFKRLYIFVRFKNNRLCFCLVCMLVICWTCIVDILKLKLLTSKLWFT